MAKTKITLVGGKQVVDFNNRYCPICQADMYQAMHSCTRCPDEQALICHDHCFDHGDGKPCPYWSSSAAGQYCKYWSELKRQELISEKTKQWQQKKVRRKTAGPSHR